MATEMNLTQAPASSRAPANSHATLIPRPLELARTVRSFAAMGMPFDQIGDRLGRSHQTARNLNYLNDLDGDVARLVEKGTIQLVEAYRVARLPRPTQRRVASKLLMQRNPVHAEHLSRSQRTALQWATRAELVSGWNHNTNRSLFVPPHVFRALVRLELVGRDGEITTMGRAVCAWRRA